MHTQVRVMGNHRFRIVPASWTTPVYCGRIPSWWAMTLTGGRGE